MPVSLSKKLINYSDLAIAVVAYIFYKIMITSQLGLLSLFLTISFTVVAGGILSYIGLLGGGILSGGDFVRLLSYLLLETKQKIKE